MDLGPLSRFSLSGDKLSSFIGSGQQTMIVDVKGFDPSFYCVCLVPAAHFASSAWRATSVSRVSTTLEALTTSPAFIFQGERQPATQSSILPNFLQVMLL